jgi:hypothetical protein
MLTKDREPPRSTTTTGAPTSISGQADSGSLADRIAILIGCYSEIHHTSRVRVERTRFAKDGTACVHVYMYRLVNLHSLLFEAIRSSLC